MSDISIRITAQEAELDALIAKLDEAMAKRDALLITREVGRVEVEGMVIPPEMLVGGEDAELPGELEDEIAEMESRIGNLDEDVEIKQHEIDMLRQRVDRIYLDYADYEERVFDAIKAADGDLAAVDWKLLETQVEIEATEAELMTLMMMLETISLPRVSRATRMILLRVPGLMQTMRLMLQIKMLQREILRPGPIGKITATLVVIMYAVQAYEKRQKTIEDRLDKLEGDTELRMGTLEDAVRGYGELPERYRSSVPP